MASTDRRVALKAFARKPAPQRVVSALPSTRLPISHPHDPAEREATRLAAPLARGESVHPVEAIGPRLHRDCAACWSGTCECDKPVMREADGAATSSSVSRADVGNMHGAPLAEEVRAPLEQQLGTDLSDVRVADGPQAADAARKLQARAFTVGDNIGFAAGAFQPGTLRGLELLAHELVHVVQQRNRGSDAVLRDDDPDQLKQEKKDATDEYDATFKKYSDAYEDEPLGLTKASYLRRVLLYTKDGPPETWADVVASNKAAEAYDDEDKSIQVLGTDFIDVYPEAFPYTWYTRLDPVLVLPFDISFAQKEQTDAWDQLHSYATGLTTTLYPIGLPVMFDDALQLDHFILVKAHSLLKHPLAPVAAAGNLYLEKKYVVDVQSEWLKYAKQFTRSVRDGTAAVTSDSFKRFRMYISAVMHPDRAVQSDITLAQAFGEMPADLEKVDVAMSKIASWVSFGKWFIGWPPVQAEFQSGLELVDKRIAGTDRFSKLLLGQSWADRWGYSDEAWKRIKEEFKKALPDMLKEAGVFLAIQFVPVLNVLADIYMIAKSALDAIEAAWDTAEAMDDVMSSKRVVDLQRHSAELGLKGRANALRIAGDLLAIKASIKALKMRAAKAHLEAEVEARAKAKASGEKAPPRRTKAPHLDTPDPKFQEWKSKLNPETRKFLEENPEVAALFEATDPAVRDLLSLCASFCIPKGSNAAQHARIKALLDRGVISADKSVKKYLHEAPDLEAAIKKLEEVGSPEGAKAVIEGTHLGGPKDTPGVYPKKIEWQGHPISARDAWPGYWGKRTTQAEPRVDAYERKINPNNESFYLPAAEKSGHVQFENAVGKIVQDGKCIMKPQSIYHVADVPYGRTNVLAEAIRQTKAAQKAGMTVEWLVSEQRAVDQLTELFQNEGIPIDVKFFPE